MDNRKEWEKPEIKEIEIEETLSAKDGRFTEAENKDINSPAYELSESSCKSCS